jgi:hypothetical protein
MNAQALQSELVEVGETVKESAKALIVSARQAFETTTDIEV